MNLVNHLYKRILILTCVVGLACSVFCYDHLPDRVALHFSVSGFPDSYGSRLVNLLMTTGLHIFLTTLFLALPILVKKLPLNLVNLPHKDFWLAPERMDETIDALTLRFYHFGILVNLFLIALNYLTYLANHSEPVRLNMLLFLAVLAIFFIITAYWLIRFYRRFSRKEIDRRQIPD